MDLVESKRNLNQAGSRHPWERARKEVVVDLIRQHVAVSAKPKTFLDIGCGDTWLVEQLSLVFPESKFIAVDIAFDEQLLSKLQARFKGTNIEVFDDLGSALKDRDVKIDAILLLDVIEHIEDDVSFLQNLSQNFSRITQHTLYFISVPAYQFLFSEHDRFLGHYRRYTNQTLREHTDQAGLNCIGIGYFFSLLLLPRLATSIIERVMPKKNKPSGVANWKETRLDALITAVLYYDYKLSSLLSRLNIRLPGLSNYIICQKKEP